MIDTICSAVVAWDAAAYTDSVLTVNAYKTWHVLVRSIGTGVHWVIPVERGGIFNRNDNESTMERSIDNRRFNIRVCHFVSNKKCVYVRFRTEAKRIAEGKI